MNFTSFSQAGQDRFVWEVSGHKLGGTFLDIGSGHVVGGSNTCALERQGWRGLMVDLFMDAEGMKKRSNPFIQADATKVNWPDVLNHFKLPDHIDYLSLDVDDATADTLLAMPLNRLGFEVLTVEHDSYRLGPGPRDVIRGTLKAAGYAMICEDVLIDYPPGQISAFEDWWVAPALVDRAQRFRCKNRMWKEIVGTGSPQAQVLPLRKA